MSIQTKALNPIKTKLMARIRRNVGELVSGKIGNVVFVQMKDRTYVRAAPDRSNGNWSTAQKMYRIRIAKLAEYWKAIKCLHIINIWNIAAKTMNGYAWFVKKNLHILNIDSSLPDPSLFTVTDGSLAMPKLIPGTGDDPDFVKFSWVNDPNLPETRLDDALMSMYYANGDFSEMLETGYKRSQQYCIFPKPPKDIERNLGYLFFFFRNKKQTLCSPSNSIIVN